MPHVAVRAFHDMAHLVTAEEESSVDKRGTQSTHGVNEKVTFASGPPLIRLVSSG
jgi:hypothetical protein